MERSGREARRHGIRCMARASKLTKSICSGAALMREGPLETRSSWPGWRITFNVSGGDGVSSKRRFRLESEEGDGAECCSGAEFECVDSGCPLESLSPLSLYPDGPAHHAKKGPLGRLECSDREAMAPKGD